MQLGRCRTRLLTGRSSPTPFPVEEITPEIRTPRP